MTFDEYWRTIDPENSEHSSYRITARQAWEAATERAAKVCEAHVDRRERDDPEDIAYSRGANDAREDLAARIRAAD